MLQERAKELFGELVYDGIFVDTIHADRTKQQRDNTVQDSDMPKPQVDGVADLYLK